MVRRVPCRGRTSSNPKVSHRKQSIYASWWSRTAPRSSGTARSLTYCDADAEDLAQAALVRALERDVVLREPTKAKHYLMRIVRNLAIDAARARARVIVEPHADVPELRVEATAEDLVLGAADLELSADALEDLPEWHRSVLQMRYVEELDYADVAERLQITEHAARQRVYRAMQALRAVARRRRFRPS